MSGQLLEVAVEVAALDAEIAADLLRQACPGGVVTETPSRLDQETDTYVPDGDGPALVKGYLHPGEDTDRVLQSIRLALQAAPLQRPAAWREPRLLDDEDWRDSWKRYFGVQRIGRRLTIVPSWVDYTPGKGDVVLRIDPGMAFGTGQHQTTAMCLGALEHVITGGESVLDLGCGSGILAIAAAKLGAARILAVDTDPQAIKATAENAAVNNVPVEAREGAFEAGETFDVIAANISGLTLTRLAPTLAASLNAGGTLIASGFLDEALDGVTAAFEAAGLSVERVIEDGQWRSVCARPPGERGEGA